MTGPPDGSSRVRVVFFGTPDFALPSLRELLVGPHPLAGVVCQPDRPAGRARRLRAPPVKELAIESGLPVLQPESVRTPEFVEALRRWRPDLIVVAAYGKILPRAVLDLPRLGCINVHASLLPKYRGAAPVQWAIVNGERTTGVTIMQLNERMDAGDILLRRETEIGEDETGGELLVRLALLGAAALREAIDGLLAGSLRPCPQEESDAVRAPMIRKRDGLIDWQRPAVEIARRVRAFHPWPSAFTHWRDRLVKVLAARAELATGSDEPGTIVSVGETIRVATGAGLLAIRELQQEGRKRLPAPEFARGLALHPGEKLGGEAAGG